MRVTLLNLIIFILLVIAGGCNKENPLEISLPGAFQYKAYDTTGMLIVKGWFTLNIVDSIHISGEWHFEQMNHYQNTGSQVGDGKLVGRFDLGSLLLFLHPGFVDNAMTLNGTFMGNTYSGTWSWIGESGPRIWGRFTADKRSGVIPWAMDRFLATPFL